MNTLHEDDARALEKFVDVFERAVINLKENDRQSDLKDGTLYTIILEKVPEKLLAQYYRWIKEKSRTRVAREAERLDCRRSGISDTSCRDKKWNRIRHKDEREEGTLETTQR